MRWHLKHIWIVLLAAVLLSAAPAARSPVWADGSIGTIGGGGTIPPPDGDEGDPDEPNNGVGKSAGKPTGIQRGSFTLRTGSASGGSVSTREQWQWLLRWVWLSRLNRGF